MALNFREIKAISWPARTAYSELEYINFNGTDNYINPNDSSTDLLQHREIIIKDVTWSESHYYFKLFFSNDPSGNSITYIGIRGAAYVNPGEIAASSNSTDIVMYSSYSNAPLSQKCTWGVYKRPGVNPTSALPYDIVAYVKDSSGTIINEEYYRTQEWAYSENPIYLMAGYYNGSADWFCNGKVYRYRRYASYNTTLEIDLVPCIRKLDGAVGMYDVVRNTFHPLQGTVNDASKGPKVSENPSWSPAGETGIKLIKDAQGNIIWGNATSYPYRRLEYVHFSGAEYFDTQFGTKQGYYREVTFALNQLQSGNSMIMGSLGPSSDNNNLRRCYNCLVGSDGRFRYTVGNASSSWQNASNLPLNTKRVTYFNIQQDNSTYNAKMNWGLKDASGNTLVSGSTTAGATGYLSNTSMSVMANNSDGNRDSFAIGNVYEIIERQTSSTGNLKHRYIPCQRKSDNVCGFYDVVDATFRAITGTNVTTTAAGPIVNEYWDLTV